MKPNYRLDDDGTTEPRLCPHCQKELEPHVNYCSWECSIEIAKKENGKIICPNGLPIRCIKADGTCMEHEHADHPDYKFPVTVEYLGPPSRESMEIPEWDQSYMPETHALIYLDGSVAVTMHECCYSIWHMGGKGLCLGGFNERKKWQLTEESLAKMRDYVKTHESMAKIRNW
jgi:hypothetical protein